MTKRPFYHRHALLILMLVCFWVPFGMRGARMGAKQMKNDVKDWLPDSFQETKELADFRRHFNAEAFVMVSWEGCDGRVDNRRFRQFVDLFFPEPPPSKRVEGQETESPAANPENRLAIDMVNGEPYVDEDLELYTRELTAAEAERDFFGNRHGFYIEGDFHQNWAGQDEKWFRGEGGKWFYIVPNGDIYKWEESDTLVAGVFRFIRRNVFQSNYIRSTLVVRPGDWDGPWYYKDPHRVEADVFKSMTTGPALLSLLTKPGGAMEGDLEGAMRRLRGVLFGPDGEQTCILVTLNDRARENIHLAVGRGAVGRPRGRILQMAERAGLEVPPPPSTLPTFLQPFFGESRVPTGAPVIRMGGPPVDNVAIDEEGQITLARLVGLSALVGVVISWISFRNLAVVVMLMFVGGTSAIFSLSIVWWGGSSFDAVLMSMPSLVYVLGLSGAVHIANYYRDTVDHEGYPGNPTKAIKLGWKPCGLAAITTAIGLVSLVNSEIVPIRKFGFFSAIGVVFTLTLLFTFLPAALSIWPPRNFSTRRKSEGWGMAEYVTAFWRRVGVFSIRHYRLVTIVCMIVLVSTAIGLPRIKTSVQLLKLFDENNKIIKDYAWLESNLGKLVPMELLIRVKPALMRADEIEDEHGTVAAASNIEDKFRLNFLERMEIAENVRTQIDREFGAGSRDITGTVMLASTFVPPLPESGGGSLRISRRGTYSKTLAKYREDITRSDYFRIDDDESELWRVSLRLGALDDVDYGEFVNHIREAIEPVMASYRYRDEIIRQIDALRDGEGFRGGNVLLLGAPLGKSMFAKVPLESAVATNSAQPVQEAATSEQPADAAGGHPLSGAREISRVDQAFVFAKSLRELMKNSSLKYRDWHDPEFALPENFMDQIGGYECVVLIQDDPRYDLDAIRQKSKCFIDTRDSQYNPEAGSLTAREKGWPISVSYTGLVPIVYKAQRTLLQSLIVSTFGAFVAILIIMAILLRSPTAGFVSMIPNVFPVVIIFGFMGWAEVLVDIGTMMTASVAMGVAVDDTIHFLTWFRRGLDQGMHRRSAIMLAYDRCATAMTQTTLIGGLGLAVFGFSTFAPTQRFGILMLVLMLAALIGDLVFLPAILAGPAGRVFSRRKGTQTKQSGKPSELSVASSADHAATPTTSFEIANASKGDTSDPANAEGDDPRLNSSDPLNSPGDVASRPTSHPGSANVAPKPNIFLRRDSTSRRPS